ncbi:MAG TPA: class II aldolase/adducin family protein, partial [Beijerinckiaceae bacterium]|nr:class II aldolase/adducin family protein [Beijerinckiaceae bacterium]
SMRSQTEPERYFISRSLAPELVTEADILEFDLESQPVDQRGRSMYLERYIHGEIYKARPDVMAVVHNHSPSVIPFGVANVPMRPLFNTAAFVGKGVPVFEVRDFQPSGDVIIKTPHLGASLARVLGAHPAALMRGHGAVVVGVSVPEAVIRSVYLELSAKLQAQSLALAGPQGAITYFDEIEVAETCGRQDSARTWERTWQLWRTKALAEIENGSPTEVPSSGGRIRRLWKQYACGCGRA